jgi:hypothetical protein
MKTKILTTSLAFLFLMFTGCNSNSLVNVLDTAVVASTAAIAVCPTTPNPTPCLNYAQAVNMDAEQSIPIASDTTLTSAQIAVQLIPIWVNVATITFPNTGPEITALQAATAAVIQLIELYSAKQASASGAQHLSLKATDFAKTSQTISENNKKIAAMRH